MSRADVPDNDVVMVIPSDRLPPGFAQRIGEVAAEPATPQPAATAVLMRNASGAAGGIELLLLKRLRSSGFVPGAYVFAGGRVDHEDGEAPLVDRAAYRSRSIPTEPPLDYWLATIREVFEESGVLLAIDASGNSVHQATSQDDLLQLRNQLMTAEATMLDVMVRLDAYPDLDALAYAAHWITPLAESRRYDTRFFYAAMPDSCEASADAREMSDAIWLRPREALERFRAGRLPMVFPTVRTIEDLLEFSNVEEAFRAVRGTTIKPILPSLVRIGDGVGIVIDAVNDRVRDKDKKSD